MTHHRTTDAPWHPDLERRNDPRGEIAPHPRSDAETQQAIAELRREVREGRDRVDALSRQNDAQVERNRAIVERMDKLEREVEEWKSTSAMRIADLISGLSALEGQVATLEQRPPAVLEVVGDGPAVTNDRMVGLERRVNDLHNDRAEHDHRITAIEEHLTAPSPAGPDFDPVEWAAREARNACVLSGQCFDEGAVVPGGASVERMEEPRDAPKLAIAATLGEDVRTVARAAGEALLQDAEERATAVPDERTRGEGELVDECDPETCNDARHWLSDADLEWQEPSGVVETQGEASTPPSLGQWRDVGPSFRHNVLRSVQSDLSARLVYGAQTHGPVFQGEPIAHLREELLDALVYLAVIEQRHEQAADAAFTVKGD